MARPRWKRLTITAIKVGRGARGALGRRASRASHLERPARPEQIAALRAGLAGRFRTALPGGSVGLRPCSTSGFCDRSATPVRLVPALRAYLVSHLGKYVPGKAMVVVVRAGMVVPFGGRASTAAIATFYETLVMMAAGGLIAAAGFARAVRSHPVEIHAAGLGPGRASRLSDCRLGGAGAGAGVSRPGRCRRCSAGWRDSSACPSPAWAPRRCLASRGGSWCRVFSGRRAAGSCWA